MKKIFISLLFVAAMAPGKAQDKTFDTVAILLLDHMTAVIGDLTSCSFTLTTQIDEVDPELGVISHFGLSKVYFDESDKMLIHISGDKGHRGFWYNGTTLTCYWFGENNYALIETPPSTMETIDTVHEAYGIDFPAADFFYPTLTDDLMNDFDQILFRGTRVIDGKECFYLVAKRTDMTVQFWIANDAMNLPVKMLIMYSDKNQPLQYEATFTEWDINPDLPDAMFEFVPPPGARRIAIQAK